MGELVAAGVLAATCGLSYLCGFRASLRAGIVGAGAMLAALVLIAGDSAVPFVLATVGPWAAGRYVRSRQALVDSLAARTGELEAQQDLFARLAVRRERARIARELHDIVSHHLAVIVVQAGAGRVASGREVPAAERFASIRRSGDEALDETGRLVDLLSDTAKGEQRHGELEVLLDQAKAAGLQLEATSLPADVSLPTEVESAAYRLVQEGLTNAMKHAPGSEVRLRLTAAPNRLEVELSNRGGSAPAAVARTGAGLGLVGMRERVEALGGRFEAGPENGGWRLFARLPTG